jgi:hypothetical protein
VRPLSESALQRAAAHELHHQELAIPRVIEVEHRGDAGMGEARERQCFAAEPLAAGRVGRRVAVQHLNGNRAIEPIVVRLPDLAHPASADALAQPVPTERLTDGPGVRCVALQQGSRLMRLS